MSKAKGLSKNFRAFLLVIVFAVVVYLIVRNISTFGNVLLVVLGFGAVVLVHEFGHFIVAKLAGIKVEAFSIGFPPVLAGIARTESGYHIRILPDFFPKEDELDKGRLSFTIGRAGKAGPSEGLGETEYRIGLIPFGGFVKMLGQEDTGPVKAGDDPRSFANKPVTTRMAVISAGVVFNAISAIAVFMIVFLIGINRVPAIVGGVVPNSPAAHAGLKAGDEIIEIAGASDNLEFSNIGVAAALSGRNEPVALKVRHADGSVEDVGIVAEQVQTSMGPIRLFGIFPAQSLTVAEVGDANALLEKTGLLPGDRIRAVNGKDVQTHWQMEEIVQSVFAPAVTVLAERTDESGKCELIEAQIKLDLNFENRQPESESDLGHIYSMVPRLRITDVLGKLVAAEPSLQSGDIILAVGDVDNPTYKEMRDVTIEHEDKELPVKVLRVGPDGVEKTLTITVVPRRSPGVGRVVIGIGVVLDAERPVVAKPITVLPQSGDPAEDGPAALAIPRGAAITAVDGTGVSDFYDIIREIRRNAGRRITIDYRLDEEIAGDVAFDVGDAKHFITVKSTLVGAVPFEPLERLYKASGPIDAIVMGYRRTVMFIAQAYVTLQRVVSGLVSPRSFIGPVGIVALSYRIVAEQPLIYYVYFLGLISAFIAVFNFLPLPPFDGGHIVLLLVEKIKGSALSERTQGIIVYAGWTLIGSFFLYVTFNDIVRSFFS